MLHPRAGTMLLLPLPAVAIGITSGLILIMVMKTTLVLQNLLWQRLSGIPGITQDLLLWIIGILVLASITVGSTIRFSQGHTGPGLACEPLIGALVPSSTLSGLTVTLILGLAGGVSLKSERPVMTVNIAPVITVGTRLLPRTSRVEWAISASAGTIDALLGTPVATTLIFSRTLNGSSKIPPRDHLSTLLTAAAAGALTTRLFFRPHFSLPITYYERMKTTDVLGGAIIAATAIATGIVTVQYLPRLHTMTHQIKSPISVSGVSRLILSILGAIGGPLSLFKGLDEMQQTVANQAFSTGSYFLLAVVKLAALIVTAIDGFHDGRIFPVVFVSMALGLILHEHVPAAPAAITASRAIPDTMLVVAHGGWLSLFMAAVAIPNTILLPLLCIVILPARLLLASKPVMMVNRQKQQSPHNNV